MTRPPRASPRKKNRLAAVTLDEASIGRSNPDVEHERAVAIYDLLDDNNFAPNDAEEGPFALHLSITGARLVFDIRRADGTPVMAHLLSLSPLRRVVKDYYTVCDSYYAAIRTATPDRIEALDMGRRSLHDEGSKLLMERLGSSLYVGSAGVRKGEPDAFAAAAMEEIGIDISAHRPVTFEEIDDLEGLNFDLIVTLSPEAHHKALELTRTLAADVEYWPTADPTAIEGSREQRLNAYRDVRDQLLRRIRERFSPRQRANE